MKRLLVIAAIAGVALWLGIAPATARPLYGDDEAEAQGKKRRDGGSRDEEKEEDLRRMPPSPALTR